jgi:hypothetical protein
MAIEQGIGRWLITDKGAVASIRKWLDENGVTP